ncbi:tryptophan--tRNA ligase [Nocardia sp. CDC159]|uniref:Tryptophan--tRNA ligase n=1 Tax=Nocardia pulmonis TaxID=2951408 RepID=A0A9X2J059_9NOCA|nr:MULTISPECIES: tryptophan--tRNA ligase [Nocardia]MCM6778148.1 tryptophan--tRNA ligase [Nocardia pulmonis]MCM6791037.1 tryptophan--tRNA ligase [Nocardia sp. CDC159]
MPRRLTAFTPSGELHLGNYFGAIEPLVRQQLPGETVVFVSDLHALTLPHDPAEVHRRTVRFAALLLACGVDPTRSLFAVQSQVPEHTELHYLLECATGYGQARRMIQFKEKSARGQQVRLSLLSYPVLMAADILLYRTDEVPVGEDQRQHVELARDIATRFNASYRPVFTVPRAVNPPVAARIMDLATPTAKMSKSIASPGVLRLLDSPDTLRHKVMRATTDGGTEVCYDPERGPGVANLLTILSACTGVAPARLAETFRGYGELKRAVADAVVAVVEPIQCRYTELVRADLHELLAAGAAAARELARPTVLAAKEAIGLLPAAHTPRDDRGGHAHGGKSGPSVASRA